MTPDLPAVEAAIILQTNQFRQQHNLAPVKQNHLLTHAASAYAAHLARSNTLAHDADGRQPAERAATAGYRYCQIAENLAMALDSRGFSTDGLASEAVEGWINSPGHRRNLLAPNVTDIGVAVAQVPDKNPKFVSVQLLGRPQSMMMTFQISNSTKQRIDYELGGEVQTIGPGYAVRHSSCDPAVIAFKAKTPVTGRYEAADGKIYVLEQASNGAITVSVQDKQTLSPAAASQPVSKAR